MSLAPFTWRATGKDGRGSETWSADHGGQTYVITKNPVCGIRVWRKGQPDCLSGDWRSVEAAMRGAERLVAVEAVGVER